MSRDTIERIENFTFAESAASKRPESRARATREPFDFFF
jgi:hypothetical protein